MKIEKGTSRIAVVGECVTLKFPQFRIGQTIKGVRSAIKRGKLGAYITNNEKNPNSLANNLLRGWLENLRERRLSREITDTIVPTRFSIFGLLNIQDTAIDVPLDLAELANTMDIPEDVVFAHGVHTITGGSNFGLHDGKLKIRDYGELGLDFLLKNYGQQLREAFVKTMAKIQAR